MSSNNIAFNNSSNNNINQINQSNNSINNNNNNNNNNNLSIVNLFPQRRIPLMGIGPFISSNSVSNRLLNNQINNINQRYNNNNNLLLRYFNSNNSNINNNQEENNNEPINEVSPMEIDNQVLYNRYEVEEEEINEKIDSVINALKLQLTKNEYELDFQLLYSKCYEICLHWKANELYKEIEKLIKNVVVSFLEEIDKLNDEEPNYNFMNSFINKFHFYSKKIQQACNALSYVDNIYRRNMAVSGGEENIPAGEDSIIKYKAMKIYYESLIFDKNIKEKIIKVVTREFINLRELNFKNNKVFKQFFEIITEKKYGNTFYNELIELITNETKKYYQNLTNKIINELGIDININKDKDKDNKENKDNNKSDNDNNKNEIVTNKIVDKENQFNVLKQFLVKLYELINNEEIYLKNIAEKDVLLNHIFNICVMNNYELIFKSCIKKLFKLNDIETFSKIYKLFYDHSYSNKEENTTLFTNSFNNMLNKFLQKISKNFIIRKNNGKIEYLNFYQYVEEIYKIKKQCANFLLHSMNNNNKIDHVIKVNFEKIINGENSESFNESFGKLLHEEIKLCQKIKNNERLIEFKDKFQCIFKFINNKDLFEENYRKLLQKRLLRNSSMMKENELIFYEIMKEENGFNYVKKIEKMINDIFYSQNINIDFRKKNMNNTNYKNMPDFYIKILSQDSWPFDEYIKNEIKLNNPIITNNNNNNNVNNSQNILNKSEMKDSKDNINLMLQKSKSTDINFADNKLNNNINLSVNRSSSTNIIISPKKNIKYPLCLSSGLELFEKYFQNQFSHRYLTYVPSLSWAEIYTVPNIFVKSKKNHSFIVSFYQVCILLHFKKNNLSVNTKILCEELNLSEEELETHYEYLVKKGLISKKNNNLLLNEGFVSEEEKINLNYRGILGGKKDKGNDSKEISHFILEDRKYQIDAAIMHLLKNIKNEKIKFEKLKELLVDYLKNFFSPEENIIKSRINNLLERNLIVKTIVNNETLYSYVQ